MVSPRLIAKIESEEPSLRLAVLIDADNAQAAVIEGLLAEIARFGEATVKRIYGDFTGLAMRLREEGLTVLGFGEKKTPEAFRNACHKFVFTEVLRRVQAPDVTGTIPASADFQ